MAITALRQSRLSRHSRVCNSAIYMSPQPAVKIRDMVVVECRERDTCISLREDEAHSVECSERSRVCFSLAV